MQELTVHFRLIKRLSARFFDYYFYSMLIVIIAGAVGFGDFFIDDLSIISFLKMLPIIILLEVLALSILGVTPGKFIFNIHILNPNKKRVDLTNIIVRTIMVTFLFGVCINVSIFLLIAVLAGLYFLFLKKKIMFWDLVSGSRVYFKKMKPHNYGLIGIYFAMTIWIISIQNPEIMGKDAHMNVIVDDVNNGVVNDQLNSPFSGQ